MRSISRLALLPAVLLFYVPAAAPAQGGARTGPASHAQVTQMIRDWPAAAREAIASMMARYGPPAAVTPDLAVWGRTGPWKRTIVYRTEYAHEFPMHHTDVMQQWIDYKVPPELYDELGTYDGSVVVERTSGEISARCDKEGANFLALNLADEIVNGKRSVEDARRVYGEQIAAMKAGRPAPYTERLLFHLAPGGTGDPDRAVLPARPAGSHE